MPNLPAVPEFTLGRLVQLSYTTTIAPPGAPDPTGLAFTWEKPSGTRTTWTWGIDPQLVRDGPGAFHVQLNLTAKGLWWWQFAATGNGQDEQEGSLFVISHFS